MVGTGGFGINLRWERVGNPRKVERWRCKYEGMEEMPTVLLTWLSYHHGRTYSIVVELEDLGISRFSVKM